MVTSDNILQPREAGRFISSRSKHVSISREHIQKAAKSLYIQMENKAYSSAIWKEHEQHPKVMNKETVDWIFVVDCLNFSFWVPSGTREFTVSYRGKEYTDYMALCAALNRANEEGLPITSPAFYKDVKYSDFQHIFRSSTDTEIPLLQERWHRLRECGNILCEKFNGTFSTVVLACEKSASRLVKMVVENFPSFRDESEYAGRRVALYKRAQILVADIWACFEGASFGEFSDIDFITMFADYRVPVALQSFGILRYSDELIKCLERGDQLPYGSNMEVEIRGCSIEAVEILKEELLKLIQRDPSAFEAGQINSVIIDFYLWDYATLNSDIMQKFYEHRTRSIFY